MREILGCWGGVGVFEGGCVCFEVVGFVVFVFWFLGLIVFKWEGKFVMVVINGLDDY